MPLAMNREVFITCAVTGSGGTQDRSPHVPRSPEQIAKSAIDAAKAGAAIVHCHVRDPETGKPSRDLKLYREVTERIRKRSADSRSAYLAGIDAAHREGPNRTRLPDDAARRGQVERQAQTGQAAPAGDEEGHTADGDRTGHHQRQRRVPGASQIEEAEHLGRVGHARDDQAEPEDQAGEGGEQQIHHVHSASAWRSR